MNSRELIKEYIKFFKSKGHTRISSAPLIPENDPTVLFTTAGMHPLVPYLLGEKHPAGKRLVDLQICVRTDDIDEVGDATHHTFFEMLGNWSLGDYWKKESLSWSWEFVTKHLGLDPKRIWVSCFSGDKDAPRDEESAKIWEEIGVAKERIVLLPKKDNWWGPAGESGPCGPDSEIYFDTTDSPHSDNCIPSDGCPRFVEIWNNVFLQYRKTKTGKFVALKQKNVDTGMGVDRTTAVLQGLDDDYKVKDLWGKIISAIETSLETSYKENKKAIRIIADHTRASVFIAAEGVYPSNKQRGYILRRLIRRALRYSRILGKNEPFLSKIAEAVIDTFAKDYPYLVEQRGQIINKISEEEERFAKTISRGLKEIEKIDKLDARSAFLLYESYGFPLELTQEIAKEKGQRINKKQFEEEFDKHKNLSRTSAAGMFKGGLVDHSEEVTKLHTATHLLHAALRKILGTKVSQKGSNITSDRLRFDFSYDHKLSDDQLTQVEDLVNEQIKKDLKVTLKIENYEQAQRQGALAFFKERYGEKVKVYTVGNPKGNYFSKEICAGPHVSSTGEIGRVRILKQEKVGSDVIRIYATNKSD